MIKSRAMIALQRFAVTIECNKTVTALLLRKLLHNELDCNRFYQTATDDKKPIILILQGIMGFIKRRKLVMVPGGGQRTTLKSWYYCEYA